MTVIRGEAETILSERSGEIAASAREIINTSDQLLELAEKERAITELLRRDSELKKLLLSPSSSALLPP